MADEFKCQHCGKVLYSEDALNQHVNAKHVKREEHHPGPKMQFNRTYLGAIIIIVLIALAAYVVVTYRAPTYDMRNPPGEKYLGNSNATVTMTEFSDFECPFCARFTRDTKPQIQQNYIDTGKVKFVFKEFPLPEHPDAEKAAEAAECAYDIDGLDAFWAMHDKMFANNQLLSETNLKRFAGEAGLNTTAFSLCLDSGVMRGRVQSDINEGQSRGVSSTPSFHINGQQMAGACAYSAFSAAINYTIQGTNWTSNSCVVTAV